VRRLAPFLAALVVAAAVTVPAVAGGSARAKVRAVTLSPLVVRGTHFKASERVRVRVIPGASRRVRASAHGRFDASFPGLAVDRCNGVKLTIVATGSGGDRAELALKLPQVACPPQD
jgi:hypothetical protein